MVNDLTVVQSKTKDLRAFIQQDAIQEQFKHALPKWLSVDRFFRVVFTSVLKNPKILNCTRESIMSSLIQAAAVGLEPVMGRAHLIPYNNSKFIDGKYQKVLECQFQPGYQGLIDLAKRSGDVADVDADVVYENDIFEMEKGSNKHLKFVRHIGGNRGEKLGAFAIWYLKDGSEHFDFMDLEELYKIRDKSQAYRYAKSNPNNKAAQECPWIVYENEQMKKTVIKRTSKLVPASIEFVEAVELDNKDYKMSGNIIDLTTIGLGDDRDDDTGEAPEAIINKFNALVLKETDKQVKDIEHLPKFIEILAQKQNPEITKVQLVESIDKENFNAFWKSFKQHVASLKTQEDATDESDNPFDNIDWGSNKLREQGVVDFYYKNKEAFATASEKSQADFRDKWIRVVDAPFPTDKPKEETPNDETDKNNISEELSQKLDKLKEKRPDLYGKATNLFGEPKNDEECATLVEWIDGIIAKDK